MKREKAVVGVVTDAATGEVLCLNVLVKRDGDLELLRLERVVRDGDANLRRLRVELRGEVAVCHRRRGDEQRGGARDRRNQDKVQDSQGVQERRRNTERAWG